MNDPIKISVVIPARNEEHYIGRCLDAILRDAAGRTDVEVIVVDSNSTDRTAEVVRRYPGVKLVQQPITGTNRARQAGFDVARGTYVAFPDADTEMPKGWLAKALGYFEKDPELICVSGPHVMFGLPRWALILTRFFYYFGMVGLAIVRLFTGKSNVVQGGNFILRRDALVKAGGFNTDLTFYGDDTDLALRLSKVGKVRFSFGLKMPISGRRMAQEGVFIMGARYALNNAWIVLFHRPLTLTAPEIRPQSDKGLSYQPKNKRKEFFVALAIIGFLILILAIAVFLIWLIFSLFRR